MAEKQTTLDITDANEVVLLQGINQNRRTILARLDPPGAYRTIYWKSEELRDKYHKSVTAFLSTEEIAVRTTLIEGQSEDVIPKNAPPEPPMHKMQGDLTPSYLEWLLKWSPIKFQNEMGVVLKPLGKGEERAADPRENWLRKDVIRNYMQPVPGTKGGEYISVRFRASDQIIARRSSHLTFTLKEIYREGPVDPDTGEPTQIVSDPYEDRYSVDQLEKLEKAGKITVVWKRPGAASSGSMF
jgi:hypothetical protein